jgi:Tol biopolymer transport system component
MDDTSQKPLTPPFIRNRRRLLIALTFLLLVSIWLIIFVIDLDNPDEDTPTLGSEGTVVYIGPANAAVRNLIVLDLATGERRQLTDFATGIDDRNGRYAVREDQQKIAFAAQSSPDSPRLDIWMVDVETGELSQLTNCAEANATCFDPTWHPNGEFVGYTREELSTDIENINRGRAWLVNINSREASLLFADEQIVGHSPRWSGEGERVAIVTTRPTGILIYDYNTEEVIQISTQENIIGAFSPSGEVFVYPQLQQGAAGSLLYSQLELINFESQIEIPVSGGRQAPVEDISATFSPDGSRLAVVRRSLDNRHTPGGQLFVIDLETGQAEELVFDPDYSHGGPVWESTGQRLVYQRFDYDTAQVDIFIYDFASDTYKLVAENGILPSFLS